MVQAPQDLPIAAVNAGPYSVAALLAAERTPAPAPPLAAKWKEIHEKRLARSRAAPVAYRRRREPSSRGADAKTVVADRRQRRRCCSSVALGLALVLPAPSSDTRELLSWGLHPALSTPKQPPLMQWMGFLVMRFALADDVLVRRADAGA